MLLGWSALTWVIAVPAVMCWPAAGLVVWLVWRHGKRHDERVRLEQEQGLTPGGHAHH